VYKSADAMRTRACVRSEEAAATMNTRESGQARASDAAESFVVDAAGRIVHDWVSTTHELKAER
jgi:hypothetical protein